MVLVGYHRQMGLQNAIHYMFKLFVITDNQHYIFNKIKENAGDIYQINIRRRL
jgi:hypothetical protein